MLKLTVKTHIIIFRMRDLSAHEKREQHQLQKEIEQYKSEITELQRYKEKSSSMIEEYEKQLSELKDQVCRRLAWVLRKFFIS